MTISTLITTITMITTTVHPAAPNVLRHFAHLAIREVNLKSHPFKSLPRFYLAQSLQSQL